MGQSDGNSGTEQVVYTKAVELMAARGYHGTSLRDVAKAVGVQMSSLYYYFPSKQDLLLAIMRRTMADLRGAVEPAIRSVEEPAAQLDAAIRAHVLFHADRREETIVTDSEIRALEDENRDEIIALRDAYSGLFVETLEAGKRNGSFEFANAHVATNAVVTMCAGVAAWYRPDGPMTLEQVAGELARLCLDGVAVAARVA